ncbi:SHOCT domain-containing protein [Agromyces kandeliae]|nr:SHOCT domain-containing protein [Agromyces kandeliae]
MIGCYSPAVAASLDAGTITQAEFDALKAKALASGS